MVAQVWVDETRPVNQGSRLAAYELVKVGIPFKVITDSSAGLLMARALGAFPPAVLARHHGITPAELVIALVTEEGVTTHA